MTQEALRMALEALEYWDVHGKLHQPTEEAITAIKEALAQPEQEPFAYVNVEKRRLEFASPYVKWYTPTTIKLDKIPLYTHLPQRTWVGLTNEELTDLFYNTKLGQQSAVEQAIALLKEKNA